MALTITVTDPLSSKLQSEATSRKISVEQFALEVLEQAVESDEWASANRRRLALIRSQFAGGLTAEEAAELQELQCRADRRLESLDSQLLCDVAMMEKAGAEALDAATR